MDPALTSSFEFVSFGPVHNAYMLACLAVWILIPWFGGKFMSVSQRRFFALFLAALTFSQEITDDLLRANAGIWTASNDLPLHMCGFSLILSIVALYSRNQSAFELAYFWGLAGALQSILTPDPGRFPLGDLSVFWNFLSHGLIILNVLWLIFAEGMRCRKGSFLNTILITNGGLFVMGFVNQLMDANYWFICEKPGGESPFLIGDWPLYILAFEIFGLLIMALIYLPMWAAVRRSQRLGTVNSTV